MARGDLSMERIVLGAALGIGAVAAAPFTGGGSVLGAATLAGSLSGIGTGLAAVTAGIVGAAIADGLGDEADYDAYFEGYEEVLQMQQMLSEIDLPERDRTAVEERIQRQVCSAREWRDVINTFFHRLSGVPDEKGRKIYD